MLCNSAADFLSKTHRLDSLLNVTPVVGFCNCSMFCCALLYVHSSFAIISMGKRELVALLCLPSRCLVTVVWLFLTMPRVCLQFVIVIFPYHAHLLFFRLTTIVALRLDPDQCQELSGPFLDLNHCKGY